MANFTREAIQNAFMKLLNEKPFKEIAVLDIVKECGISRNTFYYHFKDIPEVVESLARQYADSIIDANPHIESIADCINTVVDSWLDNKRAVLPMYKSVNRYIFEKYQWKACEYAVVSYLDTIASNVDLTDADRRILLNYMKSVCFGIVMFWLENNLDKKIRSDMQRICEIKQGDVQQLIEKFSRK